MELEIRDATPADLDAIVSIYNATIPSRMVTADTEPVTVASRRAWFDEHGGRRPLWVAIESGVVVAWLSFSSFYGRPAYAKTAEISIYVGEPHRRRGTGRILLERAITCAPSFGIATLLGFIFGHNAPSLRLFEAYRFTRWGTLPNVAELDGIARDLIIVGRALGD